jgi:hypothetical protein
MEEDLRSKKSQTEDFVKKRIEAVIDEAQERIDREAAASPEIRFALDIVEQFLHRKGRVCYGGTAMNAQLPKDLQFYSPEKDLPDYDFFTPDIEKDTEELVNDLKKSGFEDVANRVGMHEGTKKILVNYVAVADISEMDEGIYRIIEKRAVVVGGIRYTDPDILRMMMYLELSRPKGEVKRWDKVYDRLTLMNNAFPMKRCVKEKRFPHKIPIELRDLIHDFCIDNQRILAGARLEKLYFRALKGKTAVLWETREGGAVVFYSPDPKKDALTIRQKLGFRGVEVRYFKEQGDIIPARLVLSLNGTPVALIIKETACHSYNTLKDKKDRVVYIASLCTLASLYLSLAIFTNDEKDIFGFSLLCATQRFIEVNNQYQKTKVDLQFPHFSLDCRGYQKGYPTLLREKVKRIAEEKAAAKIKQLLKQRTQTRKRSTNKLNKTVKKRHE